MIEHADDYESGKGKHQPKFVRETTDLLTDLPGNGKILADATSVIVTDSGHWLGGRFNVERALLELRPIIEVAEAIPEPRSQRLQNN
jgi:hypothetical protein